MRYRKLYDNHPMVYALAKYLALDVMQAEGEKNKENQQLMLFTVNLIGQSLSQGHVCVDLEYYSGTVALKDYAVDFTFPELTQWRAVLQQQKFISQNDISQGKGEQAYLHLNGNKLYLNKYADWERRLADQLLLRAKQTNAYSIESIQEKAAESTDSSQVDWQKIAVNNSVLAPMSIIVGGPGTGKTTTVARVVNKLLQVEGKETI